MEKVKYNAPGMLVWYRDTSYGNDNHVMTNLRDPPSLGAKGGLMLVDSHFEPMRHTGVAATKYDDDDDGATLANFPTRMAASDMAFTTWGTNRAEDCFVVASPSDMYCTAYGNRGAVRSFHRRQGLVPGLGVPSAAKVGLFFRDVDASVVIPSKGNQSYSTRAGRQEWQRRSPPCYGIEVLARSLHRHRQPR